MTADTLGADDEEMVQWPRRRRNDLQKRYKSGASKEDFTCAEVAGKVQIPSPGEEEPFNSNVVLANLRIKGLKIAVKLSNNVQDSSEDTSVA